jgi:hypothetical protein
MKRTTTTTKHLPDGTEVTTTESRGCLGSIIKGYIYTVLVLVAIFWPIDVLKWWAIPIELVVVPMCALALWNVLHGSAK